MYIEFGWGKKGKEGSNHSTKVQEYNRGNYGRLATCKGCRLTVKKHLIGGAFSVGDDFFCGDGCYKDILQDEN